MGKAPRVAGVVLAAGAGRRFGMPKVLAGGGQWLETAVSTLADGGCEDIVVVLGAAWAPVPAPARGVDNPDWASGMGSSLRRALGELEKSKADLVVLHLVDLPDVGPDVVRRVVAAAGTTGLARATYHGTPGHPLAVHRRYWRDMLQHARGDQGGRSWLRTRPDLVPVPCEDLASGRDRDHPEPQV